MSTSKKIAKMRATLRANKFQVIDKLGPENCELWSNEGGDDTIHLELGSGYFQHCENGRDGTGVGALKQMFKDM